MIIGITQRADKVSAYNEYRDALDQRLVNWVIEAGFTPVPIPNTLVDQDFPIKNKSNLDNWLNRLDIDALLLSGGNSIGDAPKRDLTEIGLLKWAEINRKPVLGICRGMQIMGTYNGASLIEVSGHVGTRHQIHSKNSLEQFLPKIVNSYHNFALSACPDEFQIMAYSEDDNIEAIIHKELPWEGWMWHPEREEIFTKIDQDRFIALVNSG